MTIRFLALTESSVPGVPFRPGQLIEVESVTPDMEAAIRHGLAEIVREEPELAVIGASEKAVLRRGRKR